MARLHYGVTARQVAYAVHAVGAAAFALALTWSLHYRGGVAWASSNKALVFNLHPPLMVGFIFLFSEAVLAFRTLPARVSNNQARKAVHLSLNLPALLLAVLGIWAAFRYHNESRPPIDNMYSLHAWLGMGAAVLFGVQWLVGFLAFWFPGGTHPVRVSVLPWHVAAGVLVYAMAVAAALTGVLEKLTFMLGARVVKRFGSEAMLANSLGVLVFFLGALVVLALAVPREKSGEDNQGNGGSIEIPAGAGRKDSV